MGVSDLVVRFPLLLVSVALLLGPCSCHSRLSSVQSRQVRLDRVVLVELPLDVVVDVDELLRRIVSKPYSSERRSTSYDTFCRFSISSPSGRSARYLTLFQLNVRKYWSVGSVRELATDPTRMAPGHSILTVVDHLVL